jgi:hypothetical protein
VAFATGSITTVAVASLVDAEYFTLTDGRGTVKVFEFDKTGNGVTAGRVSVDVSALTTADQVRDAIVTAVNAQATGASPFGITAAANGSATVALTATVFGTAGNVTATENVANGTFAISGMSGAAVDGAALRTRSPSDSNGLRDDQDDSKNPISLLVWSTAGSGTMTVTLRLWGYSSVSGTWHPLGVGADSTKGIINAGSALGETGTNTIAHSEVVYGLKAFERVVCQVTAIGGTVTAISAALVARG